MRFFHTWPTKYLIDFHTFIQKINASFLQHYLHQLIQPSCGDDSHYSVFYLEAYETQSPLLHQQKVEVLNVVPLLDVLIGWAQHPMLDSPAGLWVW